MSIFRKHRVATVAIGYMFVATAVVLAIAGVGRALMLPEWPTRVAAGAAFVMMPFVIVLAWALADPGPEHQRAVRLEGGRRR